MAGALNRMRLRIRPRVRITEPPRDGVVVERDVPVAMRDGVHLSVDVFRPEITEPVPVLLCAHPYGKDNTPPKRRRGYGAPKQYHIFPQSEAFTHSAWTGWEAPDPVYWVERGYAVINADLRGWGKSEGRGELLSEQEGRDGHDLVEWAAAQPWCTGRVGMTGVSYLAISQWAIAAERPAHLAAICPWEGFTDAYRDLMRPGGIREDGFTVMWTMMMRALRRSPVAVRREQKRRPLRDRWWAARDRQLEKINVPALVCGSFSDHNLHSRGSFEGFRRISSPQKWLYTHRGPKWATYYSPAALQAQERFFGHFLAGQDTGILGQPPVRVEIREDASTIAAVRDETEWPPAPTTWRDLHLDLQHQALTPTPGRAATTLSWDTCSDRLSFRWRFDEDTEVVGPMATRLWVELPSGGDVSVFVGVSKWREGRRVGFEGSYGFTDDLVTHGMLKASHRRLDPSRSRPAEPVHAHTVAEPLTPGEVVCMDVALLPSATVFRVGEELRLDVQGRWFFRTNPLTGQLPARYQAGHRTRCILHAGGQRESWLRIPMTPT